MDKRKTDLVEEARQLRLMAEDLEKRIAHARGTRRNVTAPTPTPAPKHDPHFVGDDGPTDELMAVIEDLLTARPMMFQELLEATGARDNRIKGVIMRLQREGVRVVNMGTTHRAIWFIPSDEVFERLMRVKRATARR